MFPTVHKSLIGQDQGDLYAYLCIVCDRHRVDNHHHHHDVCDASICNGGGELDNVTKGAKENVKQACQLEVRALSAPRHLVINMISDWLLCRMDFTV